jgi:hypothetical protein
VGATRGGSTLFVRSRYPKRSRIVDAIRSRARRHTKPFTCLQRDTEERALAKLEPDEERYPVLTTVGRSRNVF